MLRRNTDARIMATPATPAAETTSPKMRKPAKVATIGSTKAMTAALPASMRLRP